MPRYTGSITLTMGINAPGDQNAQKRLKYLSNLIEGFLARPDFADIFPDFATTPEVETIDLSGPEE